ncbi:MAG: ABC transporter substrate-binding protein [Clostridiales bacterium]|nr:ABC transporter substrate-binding protein [Clostridiales bacterium]
MKKKLAILLTLVLMVTGIFAGCGSKSVDSDAVKIGLVQLVEHPSLDQIRESIIAELEEEGYVDGENIVIDYQNAQNEQSNLKTICQGFVADDVDMIAAITTPAAQVAMGETTDIPIVFAGVTDPVAAGIVEGLDNPGGNITGTSDAISIEQIMELAQEITPGFKTVGALYNSSETNSAVTVDALKVYAAGKGFQVEEAAITSTNEIQQAAQNLSKKCDIVFSPTDNTVASAISSANEVFIDAKIPFYVGADSMVKDGALATLGVNYEYLGQETAKMMIEVINGEEPGKMAVRTMKETGIYVNSQTASDMGITIPKSVMEKAKDMAKEEL